MAKSRRGGFSDRPSANGLSGNERGCLMAANNAVDERYKVMVVAQSLRVGGAEAMIENLAYALLKEGCDVRVVVLQPGETIISERMHKRGVTLVMMNKKPGMDLRLIGRLANVMCEYGPDVIHSHLPILHYVVPAAKRAGISNLVHTIHNMASKETKSWLKGAYYGHLYRSGDVVPVALTDTTRDSLVNRYGISSHRVPIVANGIDLSLYRSERSYDAGDTLEIVHIGRFEEAKNHPFIVACARELKSRGVPARIHLYGVGSLMESIKNRVEGEGLAESVLFHGLTSDVPSALSEADAFIFPSLYEGMPMVIAEAMAAGLPIVASRNGGIPDMVEDGVSGVLLPLEVEDFANAISEIFASKELRMSLGSHARMRAEAFGSQAMARNYLEVYRDCRKEER